MEIQSPLLTTPLLLFTPKGRRTQSKDTLRAELLVGEQRGQTSLPSSGHTPSSSLAQLDEGPGGFSLGGSLPIKTTWTSRKTAWKAAWLQTSSWWNKDFQSRKGSRGSGYMVWPRTPIVRDTSVLHIKGLQEPNLGHRCLQGVRSHQPQLLTHSTHLGVLVHWVKDCKLHIPKPIFHFFHSNRFYISFHLLYNNLPQI